MPGRPSDINGEAIHKPVWPMTECVHARAVAYILPAARSGTAHEFEGRSHFCRRGRGPPHRWKTSAVRENSFSLRADNQTRTTDVSYSIKETYRPHRIFSRRHSL
jgi:hypothetical protein